MVSVVVWGLGYEIECEIIVSERKQQLFICIEQ